MREYAKASPALYTGTLGAAISGDMDCLALAPYLIFGPHSNMLGLYRLPLAYIAEDLGMPSPRASEALRKLSERGFCRYDERSKTVWVVEYARHEWGDLLNTNDNRVKSLVKHLPKLLSDVSNSPLVQQFTERYGDGWAAAFEAIGWDLGSPRQALGKPSQSPRGYQEQEQEQKQDQEQEEGHSRPAARRPPAVALEVSSGQSGDPDPAKRKSPRIALALPDKLGAIPIAAAVVAGTPFAEARTLGELWACRMRVLPRRKWPASPEAEQIQHRTLDEVVRKHGAEVAARAILKAISWTGFELEWVERDLPKPQRRLAPVGVHVLPSSDEDRKDGVDRFNQETNTLERWSAAKRQWVPLPQALHSSTASGGIQ